jgi:hypothetical protein
MSNLIAYNISDLFILELGGRGGIVVTSLVQDAITLNKQMSGGIALRLAKSRV